MLGRQLEVGVRRSGRGVGWGHAPVNHHQDPGSDSPGRACSWKLSPAKSTFRSSNIQEPLSRQKAWPVGQEKPGAKSQERAASCAGCDGGQKRLSGDSDRKGELAVVSDTEGR